MYKGLYQGKITESLWNDGTIMGLPQNTEEKKNCLIEYNTYLFGQDSRAEVAKIINFIEEQLGIKKPSWIQRLYRSVVGMFTHDPK